MDESQPGCEGASEDLTWQLHRAAQRLRSGLDAVCRDQGLGDARDWVVLTALIQGPGRTQAELCTSLGLDKTTLTALLDRLEAKSLMRRLTIAGDRRARVPAITAAGVVVQRNVVAGRDAHEAQLLAAFSAQEREVLRALIGRLATEPCGAEASTPTCPNT
ncbi:MAG: MarR family winged helix-turn-helix transcriptional regulator [Candidatus Nanopelagicales bacterium]|nr:MarR family winged helix-turn-helix transcriptional regulator [Candidatus Nanopelagicales bacterium]